MAAWEDISRQQILSGCNNCEIVKVHLKNLKQGISEVSQSGDWSLLWISKFPLFQAKEMSTWEKESCTIFFQQMFGRFSLLRDLVNLQV